MNEMARLALNIQKLKAAVHLAYSAGDIGKPDREELIRLITEIGQHKLAELQTEVVATAIDWTLKAQKERIHGHEPEPAA